MGEIGALGAIYVWKSLEIQASRLHVDRANLSVKKNYSLDCVGFCRFS